MGIAALFFALILTTGGNDRAVPCNFYTDTLCFSVPQGAQVYFRMPIDFNLYIIRKGDQFELLLYEGFHPQKVEGQDPVSTTEGESGTVEVFVDRNDATVIQIYYTRLDIPASQIVHMRTVIRSPGDWDILDNFLTDVRACQWTRFSRVCDKEWPFRGLVEQIRALKMPAE